jgi:hypothetical protein
MTRIWTCTVLIDHDPKCVLILKCGNVYRWMMNMTMGDVPSYSHLVSGETEE